MRKNTGFAKKLTTMTLAAAIATATLATSVFACQAGPADALAPVTELTGSCRQTCNDTYTVSGTTNYLALRNACSYDKSNEIGRIFNGDTVELIDSSTGNTGYWYVYSPTLDMYGFVNKSYLTAYTHAASRPVCQNYTVTGTTSYLALRNACSYDRNNEIGRIFNGDTVELVDSSKGYTGYWYVYSPTLDMYGFVNKSYLC